MSYLFIFQQEWRLSCDKACKSVRTWCDSWWNTDWQSLQVKLRETKALLWGKLSVPHTCTAGNLLSWRMGEGRGPEHLMQGCSKPLIGCLRVWHQRWGKQRGEGTLRLQEDPSIPALSVSCGINPLNPALSSGLRHELPAPASVGQHLHLQPAEWLHVRPAETRPPSAPPAGASLSTRSGGSGPGQESRPAAAVRLGLLQLHQQCGEADGRLGWAGGARVLAGQEPEDPAGHRRSPARLVRAMLCT